MDHVLRGRPERAHVLAGPSDRPDDDEIGANLPGVVADTDRGVDRLQGDDVHVDAVDLVDMLGDESREAVRQLLSVAFGHVPGNLHPAAILVQILEPIRGVNRHQGETRPVGLRYRRGTGQRPGRGRGEIDAADDLLEPVAHLAAHQQRLARGVANGGTRHRAERAVPEPGGAGGSENQQVGLLSVTGAHDLGERMPLDRTRRHRGRQRSASEQGLDLVPEPEPARRDHVFTRHAGLPLDLGDQLVMDDLEHEKPGPVSACRRDPSRFPHGRLRRVGPVEAGNDVVVLGHRDSSVNRSRSENPPT